MRIRRYAARLLASSAAASSPAPLPPDAAAPWLHAAADDCDFCQLTRGSDPQVAPDGIKHKGHTHIAGPEPELLKTHDDLAQRPPDPEELIPAQGCELKSDDLAERPLVPKEWIPAQGCEVDQEQQSASEDAQGLEVTRGAAARPECADETTVVLSEVVTELAVNGGAFVALEATDEQEVGGTTSALVNGSVTEPEVTALESGSIAEPEVTGRASLAGEDVTVQEALEGVSLASGSISGPEVIIGVSLADKAVHEQEVSEGVSLASGSIARPEVIRGASLADEAVAEREVSEGVPQKSEVATKPEDVATVSGVTTGAPLDTEGITEQDIKMGDPPVNECAAEIDEMEASSGNEAAAEIDKMEDSSVNESAAEMDKMEASSVNESPAEIDRMEAFSVNEAPAEMDKMEASSVNEAPAERDKMEASSVNESAAEMDVVRLGSFVIEVATDTVLPEIVSLANGTATELDVSEGVSPASEAAPEPGDVVTALEVATAGPLKDKGVADIEMGASSVNESTTEMDFTMLGSLVNEAAAHPELPERISLANENANEREVSEGVLLAGETATVLADVVTMSGVTTRAPLDNEGIAEPDIKMGAPRVIDSSVEMDVIQLDSLVTEAAADPGFPGRVSLANEIATERDASEGVSLVSEAATEPADVVTALEVTTGDPLDNEGAAEPQIKMGASLVNESTTEMDCEQLGSPVTEATTHPGLAERVSLVSEVVTETGTAKLDTEVSVEPEATGGPSLLNESTEVEITERVSIAKEAAPEPEVTGEASACCENGGASLNVPQPLDCYLDCATVQVENAGVSVANEAQSSRDDAADEVGSVSSTSTGPVRDKSPTADEVTPHDDTPSVSCISISGIVARSVGKSGRTDIICYARRRGKRKLDMAEMETEQIEMDDGDICDQCEEKAALEKTAPCESAMSTAGSAEIKLSDIKRGLADNSASSKAKRKKGRYECDVDYCRMTFKKKAELSVHKKNMCTIKSCGKHFRSHKYLRCHHRIHNEDTPYKCPWENCSMAFKWTWALADHFQVHTGKKPYRCRTPGCSKIYKYVSDFIRHKKRCKPQR